MVRAMVVFSGGKDSVYALHIAFLQGFNIVSLLTFLTTSPHPWYLHKPFTEYTNIQANLMGFKHMFIELRARDRIEEENEIKNALERITSVYDFDYLVLGVIESDAQRMLFLDIADYLGLKLYIPLWRKDRKKYLIELIKNGIEFIVTSITSWGIPMNILGKIVTEHDVEEIVKRSAIYGFDPAFEGGEAESFVVYAPLFKRRICVDSKKYIVSEYEGYIIPERIYEC